MQNSMVGDSMIDAMKWDFLINTAYFTLKCNLNCMSYYEDMQL